MRFLLFALFAFVSTAFGARIQDTRGSTVIPVTAQAGQFFRADRGVFAATVAPRTSAAFDWSKLSGRWILREITDSDVKFSVVLDFAYLAGCGGGVGVAEYDGALAPLSAWSFESKYGPFMYAFFPIGTKFGMLLIEIGEKDAIAAKLTIVSEGGEYPMRVQLAREGGSELRTEEAKVTSLAPPTKFDGDLYFVEKPLLTGGIAFHPRMTNALTCMTDGFMSFTNPNFPELITTVSVGQKSGSYLLLLTPTKLHERDAGRTIMSAASMDLAFWQRYYR